MISIVIPCRNEAENLTFLLDEVDRAMTGSAYEVLVVDDGSTDRTGEVLGERIRAGRPLRHIRHDRSAGQSAAVRSGMLAARGSIVVTMDGDGQNDPAYLPRLAEALAAAGPSVGIVAGPAPEAHRHEAEAIVLPRGERAAQRGAEGRDARLRAAA